MLTLPSARTTVGAGWFSPAPMPGPGFESVGSMITPGRFSTAEISPWQQPNSRLCRRRALPRGSL